MRVAVAMKCVAVTQDVAWGGVLLSHGGSWARSLPKADLWPLVVLPPILGALSHSHAFHLPAGQSFALYSKETATRYCSPSHAYIYRWAVDDMLAHEERTDNRTAQAHY